MKPPPISPSGPSKIKILSKRPVRDSPKPSGITDAAGGETISPISGTTQKTSPPSNVCRPKPELLAKSFKLIDDKDWNIATSEPPSESEFFTEGNSAMNIVSVLGPMGVGKSSLLNKLAGHEVFQTHNSPHQTNGSNTEPVYEEQNSITIDTQHKTRGIDVYSNYHRILLDCQPMLAASVLEDFLRSRSRSQFPRDSSISHPMTSCHMISLQLATFLIATSDHVIVMLGNAIDVHLLKLIASAIMLIGEDNLRAKFIMFSMNNEQVYMDKVKAIVDRCLGSNRVSKYVNNEQELHASVTSYSVRKCQIYQENPLAFTGENWLSSCQKLWNSTIKGSLMFADYAAQVHKWNEINT